MKNISMTSLLVTAAFSTLSASPALAVVDGPKVAWNLSVWGPPRAFTAGIETLSKYVDQETGGKFTIKIHYGGILSKGQDNLDNIKLGSFEIAQICTGYHPGKHLGINVLDLPGLPLDDKQVHALVHDAVFKHPYIVNEFKRWDAKLLMTVIQPQSELMGVGAPPMTMADYEGMRLRALGGTGAAMKNLGAVPTSVAAPEVYNALERGVFRAAALPYTYAFASYKIADVGKWYTTNLNPGSNSCPTVVSLTALNNLPPQYRALLEKAKPMAYAALIKAQAETDKVNLAAWQKQGLTAIVYSPAELKIFQEKGAAPVWAAWVKENTAKGVPAQELLDLVLSETKKAKAQLGKI